MANVLKGIDQFISSDGYVLKVSEVGYLPPPHAANGHSPSASMIQLIHQVSTKWNIQIESKSVTNAGGIPGPWYSIATGYPYLTNTACATDGEIVVATGGLNKNEWSRHLKITSLIDDSWSVGLASANSNAGPYSIPYHLVSRTATSNDTLWVGAGGTMAAITPYKVNYIDVFQYSDLTTRYTSSTALTAVSNATSVSSGTNYHILGGYNGSVGTTNVSRHSFENLSLAAESYGQLTSYGKWSQAASSNDSVYMIHGGAQKNADSVVGRLNTTELRSFSDSSIATDWGTMSASRSGCTSAGNEAVSLVFGGSDGTNTIYTSDEKNFNNSSTNAWGTLSNGTSYQPAVSGL